MHPASLTQLELLAEMDALLGELRGWADSAPVWQSARSCQAVLRQFLHRAEVLRRRVDAPVVVATLGGTGTGKSALVNALVGRQAVPTGKQRPTTRKPLFVAPHGIQPDMLGIEAEWVEVVPVEPGPAGNVVLIDCPDPDTTENAAEADTNLQRLRHILPYCDALLVTATQQKYTSARVADELLHAALGARLVFVQTHADQDADIRDDWRRLLAAHYDVDRIYLVDSLSALADVRAGRAPQGEFADLLELLRRELSPAAADRIRRTNFRNLALAACQSCRRRLEEALPAVDQLQEAVIQARGRMAEQLARRLRDELSGNRRGWENRLLAEVTAAWGLSPFALVLRAYNSLGNLLSGAALARVRSPAQLVLWGGLEGIRRWRRARGRRVGSAGVQQAVAWLEEDGQLQAAAVVLQGYAREAGFREPIESANLAAQAQQTVEQFLARTAAQTQAAVTTLARRHTGWFTRWFYELLLLLIVGPILYRFGRNFFYDSWLAYELGLAETAAPLLGGEFLLAALFWIVALSGLLLWLFLRRLRRGLKRQIDELALQWRRPAMAEGLFAPLEVHAHRARRFYEDLLHLQARIGQLAPGGRAATAFLPEPGFKPQVPSSHASSNQDQNP